METHTQRVYLRELITQCELALASANGINMVLRAMDERGAKRLKQIEAFSQDPSPVSSPFADGHIDDQLFAEVFRNIHSLLTHASNVSKLLWPAVAQRQPGEADQTYLARLDPDGKKPKKVAARRAASRAIALRALLNISEERHALKARTLRDLRDHLEHFDERLDDWAANSKDRNLLSAYIGPPGQVVGISETDRMRNFDPSTLQFNFRGESYDLQDTATALVDLLSAAQQRDNELSSPTRR